MRLITQIGAGTLLAFGVFVLGMGSVELLNPNAPAQDREESLAAVLLFGIPSTAAGSWIFWRGHRQAQRRERDRLRTIFFNLLQQSNGQITALRFAMETGLDGKVAKTYLDDRAREFNANYNITEEGNITYHFELGGSNPASPNS